MFPTRLQSFTVARGDYFEGNLALMIVLFCISQK